MCKYLNLFKEKIEENYVYFWVSVDKCMRLCDCVCLCSQDSLISN